MRSRRNLLKSVAGIGVIGSSGSWVKPVVDTVVLPAHAQTSVIESSQSYWGEVVIDQYRYISCVAISNDIATVTYQEFTTLGAREGVVRFSAMVSLDGTPALSTAVALSTGTECEYLDDFPPEISISNISVSNVTFRAIEPMFNNINLSITIPAGPCGVFPEITDNTCI